MGTEGPATARQGRDLAPPVFGGAIVTVMGVYLALQAVYILRLPLVMDEFQGAHTVFRLTARLPYRDFQPYKTVLTSPTSTLLQNPAEEFASREHNELLSDR